MQLHQLKPRHVKKRRKRVGRGGKKGTYSGRGVKGQSSRAGRKFQPAVRELIKRYPKLRGTRLRQGFGGQAKPQVINLDILEKKFAAGETVSPQVLLEKRIIRRIRGRVPEVKILGDGKLAKSLTVENCLISKQAAEKIKAADGTIK